MIKFLRNIRQELFTGSSSVSMTAKLSKYLLYAIGEIILVVIGILIALAINNSNQHRIIKEKEQSYLISLREEFLISKSKLTELIGINKSSYDSAKKIVDYISNKDDTVSDSTLSKILFSTLASDISFNPNNSLLNEMMNSGSLKDVSNKHLRILLTNWISTNEDISNQENELAVQREKILDMFRSNEYSIRTIFDQTSVIEELELPRTENNKSNLGLLRSTAFENNLLMFILTSYATEKAHYMPLMQDLNAILKLIESEIDNS